MYISIDTRCKEFEGHAFYETMDGNVLVDSIPLQSAARVDYSGGVSAIRMPDELREQFAERRRKVISAPECRISGLMRRDDILTLCFGNGDDIDVKIREKRRFRTYDELYDVYGGDMLCSDKETAFDTDIEGIFGGLTDGFVAFELGYEWLHDGQWRRRYG